MKDQDWRSKPDYRKNPRWFQKRNKALIADKKNGMSIAEICAKYNMTQARMYSLVKRGTK